jgi:hypothetical protein
MGMTLMKGFVQARERTELRNLMNETNFDYLFIKVGRNKNIFLSRMQIRFTKNDLIYIFNLLKLIKQRIYSEQLCLVQV